MPNLTELKELREKTGVTQDEVAGWIGKARVTYTKKEGGNLPLEPWEEEIIRIRLEMRLNEGKEVPPPCGLLEPAQVETVCKKIGQLYKMTDTSAIQTFEYGLKWIMDLAEREAMLKKILSAINDLDERIAVMEELLKKEGLSGEKPAAEGARKGGAAV